MNNKFINNKNINTDDKNIKKNKVRLIEVGKAKNIKEKQNLNE